MDPGHGHVHIIRNEGAIAASTIAVQLVPFDPAKANRRIDARAPETCSNIACSTPLGDSFLHLFFSSFDPQRRGLVGVG
jgi:hypothetical protein